MYQTASVYRNTQSLEEAPRKICPMALEGLGTALVSATITFSIINYYVGYFLIIIKNYLQYKFI